MVSKKAVDWLPLQDHPVFSPKKRSDGRWQSELSGGSGSSNLAAWDAASSRLYLWDPHSDCLHRLSLRFRDPDPSFSPAADAVLEAAVPSEALTPDTKIRYTVRYISLNEDRSSLIIAGSEKLDIMYLHERISMDNHMVTCRTISVASQIFLGQNSGLQILQASWHPYSNCHLGILSSDSIFRLFDLSSDIVQPEQEYYLQPVEPGRCCNAVSICPITFTFGGPHLWDRFSVFVLFSDGLVYVLCPIVPFGSLCSRAYIEEIYEDVNAFGLKSSNMEDVSNSRLAIGWLEATFPELADQSSGGNVLVSRAQPYVPMDATLSLQGPLCKVCHGEESGIQRGGGCEGRAVSFLYSSIGKDTVLTIGWSSGQLQIDALADEVQPHWNIGSSPRLRVDSYGHIKGIAMISELSSQEKSALNPSQSFKLGSNISGAEDAFWLGHPPPLLRLAVVDLALPKPALNHCRLSLFSDPLFPKRFYCVHGEGIDSIALHFLPFENLISETDKIAKVPSVHSILSACSNESSCLVVSGFVTIADSYGHLQIVGITSSYECIMLEMRGWNDSLPFHYSLDNKSANDRETVVPEFISKELVSGPKVILVPPSTTLRLLTADSIEGRSTLHHYVKLFHENYVEYAHKVYIELKEHAGFLKTIIDDQHKRLHEAKQLLLNFEAKEQSVKDRINRATRVYELLEQRLHSFKALCGSNRKPLSRAERDFKAELDRFADLELEALHSSIEALNARLKRYSQSPAVSTSNAPRQTTARKNHASDGQVLQLKSSMQILSHINDDITNKVKLIEHELNSHEK